MLAILGSKLNPSQAPAGPMLPGRLLSCTGGALGPSEVESVLMPTPPVGVKLSAPRSEVAVCADVVRRAVLFGGGYVMAVTDTFLGGPFGSVIL